MCVAMVEGKAAPVNGGPHPLYNHLAQFLREQVKDRDNQDDNGHDSAGALEVEAADEFPQDHAYAGCCDHGLNRGGAVIGLEAVVGVGDPLWEFLGLHGVDHFFHVGGACGAHTFHRGCLNGFHGRDPTSSGIYG